MNLEERLLLFRQIMRISGIFTAIVALLLIINFAQMKSHEPLESEALNTLVEQLKDDPNNEVLIEEIRELDLLVRKAYFTTTWQVNTGAWLMIIGAVLFAVSLKLYTDTKRKIEEPESDVEDVLKSRIIAMRWLLISGAVIFGMAAIAAFSTRNYLNDYGKGIFAEEEVVQDESIEVVEVIDPALVADSILQTPGGEMTGNAQDEGAENIQTSSEDHSTQSQASEATTTTMRPDKAYTLTDFRNNHNTFRGPLGHGVSYHKNIPTHWNGASGEKVKWKVAISKPGYNSPITWGDRLFIAGADEEARIVSCYNRNTGELLWEKAADNIQGSPAKMPKVTDDTGLSAPTMAVDGNRVYAIFATGDVIAFDLDGNRVWARNLGVPRNHYGHSSSLMVWDGKLVVQYDTGSGGRMLALNTRTGESVWDVQRDNNISWASPILVEQDGKMRIITNTDPNVAAHDLQTGEEIWKQAIMMGEVGPSCAYDDGLVFANNEYASLVAIKDDPGAEIVWEAYDYLSEAASPVAYNGLLYLATSYGVLACYDNKTGDLIWEKDFGVTLYSSPVIADGKLFIMDNTGQMHILKADRSGEMISEPVLGEASYAVPAFAEGRIYIRGANSLYCIEN